MDLEKIVYHLRRVQPDVVVTFDQNGAYGHPDHIAICQFTTAAVMAAADPAFGGTNGWQPHRVSKLYYMVWNDRKRAAFESGFGELIMHINGEPRGSVTWEDWAITAKVDASKYSDRVWDAITCHRTQLPAYNVLKDLPSETHVEMWGNQMYYRAYSLVNSGPKEQDLFAGLR